MFILGNGSNKGAVHELSLECSRSSLRGYNLTQSLVDEIGLAIVTGRYPVRQRIPSEREICLSQGVSRVVVREAKNVLAAKGLLATRTSKGTRVLPQTEWNLLDRNVLNWLLRGKFSLQVYQEFCQARAAIEPSAAWFAANRATPKLLADIEHTFKLIETACHGFDRVIDAQISFHQAVLKATGNAVFVKLDYFVSAALRYRHEFESSSKPGSNLCLATYARLFEAIAAGHADAARRQMKKLNSE